MSGSIKVLAASLVATGAVCLVLAYLWIDQSISLTYMRESADSAARAVRSLEHVLEVEWKGQPKELVLSRLQQARKNNQDIIIKDEGDIVWFDEVPLVFEKNRLQRIGGELPIR